MKKSIIVLSTMFLLAVGTANAQTEKTEPAKVQQTERVQDEKKMEIKQDALPAKVQETLKSDTYKSWEVSKVYETTKGKAKMYEVVLMNGEKKATYTFDAEGKTIG